MKRERNIAFIVELLLLFVILLFVIVVITQTFMKSRGQSLYARHLTEAVTLAEEVAEVSASAADLTDAADRFDAMEQVQEISSLSGEGLDLVMDFAAENGVHDRYRVELDWLEEKAADGSAGASAGSRFVTKQIRVYFAEETVPIYTLDSGDFKEQA